MVSKKKNNKNKKKRVANPTLQPFHETFLIPDANKLLPFNSALFAPSSIINSPLGLSTITF